MIRNFEIDTGDGVHGLDDTRAAEALHRWHAPYDAVGDWTQRPCRRCRQIAIIVGDGLCAGCHADRQWTLVNRALCDLLHRRIPGRQGAQRSEVNGLASVTSPEPAPSAA